ncbi:expressed unknown protein [Seminavis robusta]|uniref:DUF6824 domain-containing protein n=1 Tax=Seminavis robusta TaxID=568900 RepID=A0A9N8EK37_9STRA|nr:expressed unknown protein [Seminavis robusta]|eukprot:Sro1337_g264120.1 n/a (185) ;mRNA; r:15063-15778
MLVKPMPNMIALGRGGMANNHVGNKEYRTIIARHKTAYLGAKRRKDKHVIVKQVFVQLKERGFTFVEKIGESWVEASTKRSRGKVVQALREGAPTLRKGKKTEDLAATGTVTEQGAPATDGDDDNNDAWVDMMLSQNDEMEVDHWKQLFDQDSLPLLPCISFEAEEDAGWQEVDSFLRVLDMYM